MKSILASGWYLLAPLALVGLGGCTPPKPPPPPKGPPEVEVSLPVAEKILDFEEFSGRLESKETVQVRARVTGYLLPMVDEQGVPYFKEGGKVEKGQVLFKIDPPLYEAELARAKANLEQAEARLQRLTRDVARAREMFSSSTIGREEFDRISGDRTEAAAAVGVARAALKIAQVNMDYTTVRAPLAGLISKRMVDPGNLVKADDTVLTAIGASDPIKATFDVDERTVVRIMRLMREGVVPTETTGVPVSMGLADEEGRPHHGTIDFLDTYVDPGTGTLRVRGAFANPDPPQLVPGMFVRVRLPIGQPEEATLVAEEALVPDQGQKFIYVIKDSTIEPLRDDKGQAVKNDKGLPFYTGEVEYRQVTLGRVQNGLRVLKKDVKKVDGKPREVDVVRTDEKVIVKGLQRVRPGAKVKFTVVPMPKPAAGTSPAAQADKAQGDKGQLIPAVPAGVKPADQPGHTKKGQGPRPGGHR